jgi:hypothetical protein
MSPTYPLRIAHQHDDHNPATLCPNSRPNYGREWMRDKNQIKVMGMTDQEERLARERAEIAARVASFKATQEKFEREREDYFVTTLDNARNRSDSKSFWS